MTDLLRRIRTEIDERLAASREAVEEMERLEAALRALEGVGGTALEPPHLRGERARAPDAHGPGRRAAPTARRCSGP